jgi:hypothetical protein
LVANDKCLTRTSDMGVKPLGNVYEIVSQEWYME